MSIKTVLSNALGNALVALGGSIVMVTSATAIATKEVGQTAPVDALHQSYVLVGFALPNWVGIILYIVFLVFGVLASINQPTPVDDKIKYKALKPLYSLIFGITMTLFVMPLKWQDLTIWQLIVPAMFFAAIGAVVIVYVIAFFTSAKLWGMVDEEAHGASRDVLQLVIARIKAVIKAAIGGDNK